ARTVPLQLLLVGRSLTHAGGVVPPEAVAAYVLLRVAARNPPAVTVRPVHESRLEDSHPDRAGLGRHRLHLPGRAALRRPRPRRHVRAVAHPHLDAARRGSVAHRLSRAALPARTATRAGTGTRARNQRGTL